MNKFAGFASAVLVEVAPDFELAKGGVGGVDNAVAIVVEHSQLSKAGATRRAEHLGGVADQAVAVEIADQKAVIGADPAVFLGKIILVEVEMHRALGQRDGLDAVAVKIEHQRVVDRLPEEFFGEAEDRLQSGDELAEHRGKDRDLMAVGAHDAEQHAEIAGRRDAQSFAAEPAESVVLDDHRGLQRVAFVESAEKAVVNDQLAAVGVAVEDERQQPVHRPFVRIILKAEKRVGAAGQRDAQ